MNAVHASEPMANSPTNPAAGATIPFCRDFCHAARCRGGLPIANPRCCTR